tara:strand:- start:93 stop:293 length:201 start_codon:yes stop_codon:yes gene_type:complete
LASELEQHWRKPNATTVWLEEPVCDAMSSQLPTKVVVAASTAPLRALTTQRMRASLAALFIEDMWF